MCSQKDNCINTDGGFNCSCSVGYKMDKDERTCTGTTVTTNIIFQYLGSIDISKFCLIKTFNSTYF